MITRGAYRRGPDRVMHEVPEVYNLDVDPGERYDVAGRHPEVVRELTALADPERGRIVMSEPLIGVRT